MTEVQMCALPILPTIGIDSETDTPTIADPPPQAPPAPPAEPVAPAETVAAQVKRLVGIFGGDLCGKAKLRLIKPDGSHFTADDKKLTKGQANELERILNAGGLE